MSQEASGAKDLLSRIKRALDKATSQLEELKYQVREPVAVIGMAGRFPGADTPEEFWSVLERGADRMAEIPSGRWPVEDHYDPEPGTPGKYYVREGAFLSQKIDEFDAQFFGISPREAMSMDPQQRLLLEVAWEAFERAGLSPTALKNGKTGVFVGVSPSEYPLLIEDRDRLSAYVTTGNSAIFAAGRLSYVLGLQGPSLVIDTACSASLIGVHQACESLRSRACDLALAGGVHLIVAPHGYIQQSQMRTLAPDGRCKTFDAAANGYGRGEGCGLVVLKRLSDALAEKDNILALIRGSATNHDGPSSGLTVPSATAQAALIRQALLTGKVDASEVSYVEAHGTGTALGDPIEVRALSTVFGQREVPLWVGSVKTNIGHLEEAAGVTGLIKVILSMQHGQIPPHLHFRNPSPHIDWNKCSIRVPTECTTWDVPRKIAGVSSFGLGGSNAHLVLEEAPPPKPALPSGHPSLFTLSAKSPTALRELAHKYSDFLSAKESSIAPAIELADLCHTTHTGRSHFAHRLSIVADTLTELQEQLSGYALHPTTAPILHGTASLHNPSPKIAFLFTGHGSQYVNMGREIYESKDDSVAPFREVLDRGNAVFQECFGRSLLGLIYPAGASASNDLMESHPCGQAANYVLGCGLFELWQSWGIRPAVVLGHSLGDFVAAYAAGVFSLEDGLRLVLTRGRLMETAVGSMVSVLASDVKVAPFLAAFPDVAVAAINGPHSIVLSGGHRSIEQLTAELQAVGYKTRKMEIPVAAHSPLLDPVLDSFAAAVRGVPLAKPRLPLVSSMTGKLAVDELIDPGFWRRQLRSTVQFAQGVATLRDQGISIFVEMGPRSTLSGMAGQLLLDGQVDDLAPYVFLPSLREGLSDWRQLLTSLGVLYVRGIAPDWAALQRGSERRKVVLPTYAFERQRHWVEAPRAPTAVVASDTAPKKLTPLLEQLQAGERQQVLDALSASGKLSAAARAALPEIIDQLFVQQHEQAQRAAIADWLYEVVWRRSTESPIARGEAPGSLDVPEQLARRHDSPALPAAPPFLIFTDAGGLGEVLAQQLAARGQPAVCVEAGDGYRALSNQRFTIHPDQADDYRRLLSQLPTPRGIAFLGGLDAPLDDPLRVAQQSCVSLLYLVQALQHSGSAPPQLWLVTCDAQAVQPADRVAGIGQSPLWGLGQVLRVEHPELRCVCVDLDGGAGLSAKAAALTAELLLPAAQPTAPQGPESQVAWRRGQRHVARLSRQRRGEPRIGATPPAHIRANATYLITGGLGGLGMRVASWLVAAGARRLVLLGRSRPSPTAQAQVEDLQSRGAEVAVAQADVSDRAQLAAVLARIDDRAPLTGIVHAAADSDGGGLLLQQTPEKLRRGLSAKVAGAFHLHSLTASGPPLDFFVCFSSMTTLFGDVGLASYIAANSFLDALAHHRRAAGLAGLSIDWGIFSEVGAAVALDPSKSQLTAQGHQRIAPEQGLAALAELLGQEAAQVCVTPLDWSQFSHRTEARDPFFAELCPAHRQPNETSTDLARAGSAMTLVDIRGQFAKTPQGQRPVLLTQHLATLIAQVLRLPSAAAIDPGENLLSLGFDSLMAVELRNHIRRTWGIDIPLGRIVQGIALQEIVTTLLEQLVPSLKDAISGSEAQDGEVSDEQEWMSGTL